jgi:glycosyltransferase involved in cell wall biosynthesis
VNLETMTILQLISSEGFFGAENMLTNLARSLSRLGYDPVVGVFRDRRNPHTEVGEVARESGLTVRIIPCNGRWDWKAVKAIRALIDEASVDVLHCHGYKADLYGYAASWPDRLVRVSTCHNWPNPAARMQVYASLDRLTLRGFDAVTTPSPRVAKTLRGSGIKPERLSWIKNGVDVASFRDATPTLRRELDCGSRKIVGFAGRMVAAKGGATLLAAARRVLAADRDVLFVFTGEGPEREEWQALSASLGIEANVVFTGTRDDMPGVYASLDVFVLPSFDEAMPMTVLEAMSAAKPVIATRVGAVPELIADGETGYLCAPGDVNGLSEAILTVLGDRRRALQMGEAGYARVANGFSSDDMARSYLRVYEKALASERRGIKARDSVLPAMRPSAASARLTSVQTRRSERCEGEDLVK